MTLAKRAVGRAVVPAFVAAVILIPLGFGRWRAETAAATDGPPLAFDAADLDLGAVWAAPGHEATVRVRNLTGSTVRVAGVKPSCGCTTVQPAAFTVPPGGTIPLTVTLDLHPTRPEVAAEPGREWAGYLDFLLPERPRGVRATLTADVRHLLTTVPRVDFDGPDAPIITEGSGSRREPAKTVTLHAHPGVRTLRLAGPAEPLAEWGSADADATDDPDDTFAADPQAPEATLAETGPGIYELAVRPPPALTAGRFSWALPLAVETDDGATFTVPAVAVKGEVLPNLELLPALPRLPPTTVGGPASVTLTLRSRTGTPFELREASAEDGAAAAPTAGGPAAASHAPRDAVPAGPYAVTCRLRTDRDRRTLTVRGHGLPPAAHPDSRTADARPALRSRTGTPFDALTFDGRSSA